MFVMWWAQPLNPCERCISGERITEARIGLTVARSRRMVGSIIDKRPTSDRGVGPDLDRSRGHSVLGMQRIYTTNATSSTSLKLEWTGN